jgi:hypothetical protein
MWMAVVVLVWLIWVPLVVFVREPDFLDVFYLASGVALAIFTRYVVVIRHRADEDARIEQTQTLGLAGEPLVDAPEGTLSIVSAWIARATALSGIGLMYVWVNYPDLGNLLPFWTFVLLVGVCLTFVLLMRDPMDFLGFALLNRRSDGTPIHRIDQVYGDDLSGPYGKTESPTSFGLRDDAPSRQAPPSTSRPVTGARSTPSAPRDADSDDEVIVFD